MFGIPSVPKLLNKISASIEEKMSEWLLPIRLYFWIIFHSVQKIFRYFLNLIFHPSVYNNNQRISVPPSCLTDEENGSHQYAKLSHRKFHYVERGDRNNRLLILIHGYPEFWYSWRYQLRNLSTYYWVVAIDMKGFGDSDKPRSQNEYDISLLVHELHYFLLALGRQKCSIVSHGLGGLVAWYFLNEFPDAVDHFVSIGSAHPLSFLQELTKGRTANAGWYYFCPVPYFPEKEEMKQDLQIFNRVFAKMLKSRRGNMTQQDVEAYKYTFSRYEDWVGPINYFRTLLLRQRKYKKPLKKSTVPTLLIVGNSDPFCTLEMICKSSEYAENFTLKIVEGGGHFLPQEMPNYVNSLILDFMKMPEPSMGVSDDPNGNNGLFKKVFGAGKTVFDSTLLYGSQVWTGSKEVLSKGYNLPKKIVTANTPPFPT